MSIMAVLLNHALIQTQIDQARELLGVTDFRLPPHAIEHVWAYVDPELDTKDLPVTQVTSWLETATAPGDFVLIQGDWAMTFAVVTWCLSHGRVALHATTRREVVETHHGEQVHTSRIFRHVRFRPYCAVG